jgi:hypothetical protein
VYDAPFFPGATYDPAIPTPDSVLGFPVGSRPANHAQIETVIRALAAASPRCKLFEYGVTHEGRKLYYLVIASPERLAKLEDLKHSLARLADPRQASAADVDASLASLPAVAWMAYCIHGDEMSGSDASLAVAHHLAASRDADVSKLLDNLVVIIDPLMNPDGRDRCITAIAQNRTVQPSVDDQSLIHSGVWPSGRMNHYLFDMNRDWMFATQPETRGRIAAVRDWSPHYFMESHEMGSQDTFLFMPPREPVNPNYPPNVRKWVSLFAGEQAAAFDARGWRYYTGEWNEEWYPGYSSSWAALRGCVENLYEQASISTDAVRRPEGTLESYREAVHKQLVSTMANLATLSSNRAQVLADFVAEKRRVMADDSPYAKRSFAIVPGPNIARARAVIDLLRLQGIDILESTKPFSASGKDRLGRDVKSREFPAGTLIIPGRQPLASLAVGMLEFDPRMTAEFLTDERRELLRFDRSRLYDVTGWNIPMLFDLDAYELVEAPTIDTKPVDSLPAPASAPLAQADSTIGFVIDGADDRSVSAAARLMESGVWVRVADKPFTFDGRALPRGSVIITRKDNPSFSGDLSKAVSDTCAALGIAAAGMKSGLGPGDLPDLGGEHFVLLQPPRIAVLGREPFGAYSFGAAWHAIDHTLGVRASYLDFSNLSATDLRRYNVIVVPDGAGPELAAKADALRTWVQGGGTLIAIGKSAGAFAVDKTGIGSARLLQDILAKPEPYYQSVIREWEGQRATVDPARIWTTTPPPSSGDGALAIPWDGVASAEKPSEDELKRRDEWRRIFSPQGVLLAGRTDDRSWLTAGARDDAATGGYIPVMLGGPTALVVPPGVQAPVRLGYFNTLPPPPPAPAAKPEAAPTAGTATPEPTIAPPDPAKPEATSDPKADTKPDAKPDGKPDKSDKPEKPKPGWTIAPPGYELRLRMSGLLWPEAAERLANTAYLTRESIGSGQIILFADDPNFRAAALGTSRLFANAIVYGPGMGASQPIKP